MTAYEDVRSTFDGHVATVSVDRPPRNAFVPSTLVEIRAAVAEADDDPEVRCIVLTGTGRYFATGADLTRDSLLDPETGMVDRQRFHAIRNEAKERLGVAYRPVLAARVPVVVAVNGSAAGAGLGLALQGDIRVVADDASYSFAFVRRGLAPEMGVSWLLPRVVGIGRASELLLTGRTFTGAEAAAMGLASAVVAREEVLATATRMAHDIAEGCSPLAAAFTKRLLWASTEPDPAVAFAREQAASEWVIANGDAGEGILSYLQHRPSEWSADTSGRLPFEELEPFDSVPEDYI